ncbi:Predicted ABC-type transport, ATPase component/CCR4 associated factor [Ceraceosorus bombacis]|uniref:Predicted ABC-type transport, ATPase component/CCR4 associated factor n=1 Tax=Ceraceosorus bombacis TaxID=401625 RepID=A0A0P1BLD7_9BASI|nr:Predicted ABC-type transport, ATPase component/CCR4 associated factor [Ceraceosorus bombacis]
MSKKIESVAVFCGSSPGRRAEYLDAAQDVGATLAKHKLRLVYGGGTRGIMGGVSAAVLSQGGRTLGILPRTMLSAPNRPAMPTAAAKEDAANPSAESAPASQSGAVAGSAEGSGPEIWKDEAQRSADRVETILVDNMHERKAIMQDKGDAFIVVPGGYGTFEEAFEVVTWCQLGIHRKPVIFLNVCGFYEGARTLITNAAQEGFISPAGLGLVAFVEQSDADKLSGSWGEASLKALEELSQRIVKNGPGYWDWSKSKGVDTSEAKSTRDQPEDVTKTDSAARAVDVTNLTFSFSPEKEPALIDCNLSLTRGSRCLLIGANGAGKSTLLRLLAGKRLPGRDAHVRVYGRDVFHDAPLGGYRHKERRDRLLDILDVDVAWRMHQISDGERRRVQLTMGLMEEWTVLLLDEVTVDLDVQVRADLLDFLMTETRERGATIIYATHIFDGLQTFPTHVVHMQLGTTTTPLPIAWPPSSSDASDALPALDSKVEREGSVLLATALAWLRQDRELRLEKEQAEGGQKKRGAQPSKDDTDSSRFYSAYDYSH